MGEWQAARNLIDAAGSAVRKAIRAYHASPYSFDAFDSRHIGSGEGAQAYAHGLYFAQSPAVMEEYYKQFKAARPGRRTAFQGDVIAAGDDMLRQAGSRELAISQAQGMADFLSESPSEAAPWIDVVRYLQGQAPAKPTRYEVDIRVPESALMDWDAPLSAQPGPFKDVLRQYDAVPELPASLPWEPVGAQAYRTLVGRLGGTADDLLDDAPSQASVSAAQVMRDAGVPGVRYFDIGSRSSQRGTRNYVMFPGTEDRIRILRKYGLAPATLGAEELLNQQPEESMAPASGPR